MNFRRFLALGAVLVALIVGQPSVSAEEGQMNALQTALSSTTISGYVDTSVEWTLGSETTVQSPTKTASRRPWCWWWTLRSWFRLYGW